MAARIGSPRGGRALNRRHVIRRGAGARREEKALAAIDADTDLAGFLDLVIGLVREGMFADPAHGGNDDGIGWALIGYPGPRASWTENEQELT